MIKCRSHVTVSSVQRNVSRWLSSPNPVLLCLSLAILGQVLTPPPPSPPRLASLGCRSPPPPPLPSRVRPSVPRVLKTVTILLKIKLHCFNLMLFRCAHTAINVVMCVLE